MMEQWSEELIGYSGCREENVQSTMMMRARDYGIGIGNCYSSKPTNGKYTH